MPRIIVVALFVYGLGSGSVFAQQQNDAQDQPARAILIALAASSASLQGYDTYSTLAALSLGGREVNPVMRSVAQRPAAFVAVKAGVTASSIVVSTRLWKQHHRTAAIALLAITNGAIAAVAVHNASVLHSMRASRR